MRVIAHNIRSLHNVGSIFRSADVFGVERVYLTGFTGQPPRKEIAKTALGAEDRIPWEHHETVLPLIRSLQEQGMQVVAIETGASAVDIRVLSQAITGPVALVLGNEVEGLETSVLDSCDAIACIPMPGRKQSLNVSVAAGIALFTFEGK